MTFLAAFLLCGLVVFATAAWSAVIVAIAAVLAYVAARVVVRVVAGTRDRRGLPPATARARRRAERAQRPDVSTALGKADRS